MPSLTLESMNGTSRHLRGLAGPLTIEIDHGDAKARIRHELSGLGQANGNWAYPARVPPRIGPNEFWTKRRLPEPGETWAADHTYPSKPMTPQNDERNLPDSETQLPILQLPRRDYPGSYPHGWIDYEDMAAALGPDLPPIPPGWLRPMNAAGEKQRAIDAAMPTPWSSPERMARDISGMGGLAAVVGASVPSDAVVGAAAGAVATQAAQAQAAGAPSSIVNQIVEFGSSVAALYLQKRAIDQTQQAAQAAAQQQAALAAQARAMQMPAQVVRQIEPETPWYKSPVVLVLGALAAAATGYVVVKSVSKKGRR